MPCTRDHPCGGLLREVLVTDDATIYQCIGSAHTFRDGPDPLNPPQLQPGRFSYLPGGHSPSIVAKKLSSLPRDCPTCKHSTRRNGLCRMHEKIVKGCPGCHQSKAGRCALHGGPTRAENHRKRAAAWREKRKRS